VFGVLNLVFTAMGLFGMAATAISIFSDVIPQGNTEPEQFYQAFNRWSLPLSVATTVLLGISGVGLLRMRSWGRTLALVYAMIAFITSLAGIAIVWFFYFRVSTRELPEVDPNAATIALFGAIGGTVGGIFGLIYPALLWYFMTRPHVIAAFQGATALPAGDWDPNLAAPRTSDLSNPYSSPETGAMPPWSGQPGSGETIVETFIPSKNGPALAAYYLGIFSLFPCLGFPLGIAAVYFGIQGLRRVRATPEVRGGAHAWAGVICGSLFGLFNLLLIGLLMFGAVAAAMGY
jgi:hypothetical protein